MTPLARGDLRERLPLLAAAPVVLFDRVVALCGSCLGANFLQRVDDTPEFGFGGR